MRNNDYPSNVNLPKLISPLFLVEIQRNGNQLLKQKKRQLKNKDQISTA